MRRGVIALKWKARSSVPNVAPQKTPFNANLLVPVLLIDLIGDAREAFVASQHGQNVENAG